MEIDSYEVDVIAEDSSFPAVWYLSSSVPLFVHLCCIYHNDPLFNINCQLNATASLYAFMVKFC